MDSAPSMVVTLPRARSPLGARYAARGGIRPSARGDADLVHRRAGVVLDALVEDAVAHAVVVGDGPDGDRVEDAGVLERDLLGGAGDQRALGRDDAEEAEVLLVEGDVDAGA